MTPLARCDAEIARIRREPLPCWLAALAELDWIAEAREIMTSEIRTLRKDGGTDVREVKWHRCQQCGGVIADEGRNLANHKCVKEAKSEQG